MKKRIHIDEEKLLSTIKEAIADVAGQMTKQEPSVQLNNPSDMLSEMARINLGETNIFPYDSYAIWVHSEDHNPPHFHVCSRDNWDVCFYIQTGELYRVKNQGDNEQTFSYIEHNVKKWLSCESARVKGYTNQENAMLAWDEIHAETNF